MPKPRLPGSKAKVNKLERLLKGRPRALILVHDNPDPDAMAGALALARLVDSFGSTEPLILYGGIIGRAENRNMVAELRIPLRAMAEVEVRPDDAVILVDTQPGFANNSLPRGADVLGVIDHHSGRPHGHAPFVDVRPGYGAVSTILTEYLVSARIRIASDLASAICYGISAETQDLGREASRADVAAMVEMFPLADQRLLGRLQHPRLRVSFFRELDGAIRAARRAGDAIVCHLDALSSPDVPAEMADMLVSIEGIRWAMCTGQYGDRLQISLRTWDRRASAGQLLRRVVGKESQAGGHGMIAGGSVELGEGVDADELRRRLTRRFLQAIGRDLDAELPPLLP